MAELKTQRQPGGVDAFLQSIEDEQKKQDSIELTRMLRDITGEAGDMWGSSVVGFGRRHLTYASGRELDWFIVGFSPRKANITLYLGLNLDGLQDLLAELGPHTLGKGCVYIKRLSDVDLHALTALLRRAYDMPAGEPGLNH